MIDMMDRRIDVMVRWMGMMDGWIDGEVDG